MNHYITVLTVRRPSSASTTKLLFRIENGNIGETGYDNASRFDVQKIPIDDIADLSDVLFRLATRPDQVVIRGKPARCHDIRRRIHGDEAAFAPDPDGHHWMLLDFDEVDPPIFIHPNDHDIAGGYLVRLLPQALP